VRVVLVTSLQRGGPVEQALVLARGLASLDVSVRMICADREVAGRAEAAGAEPVVMPLRHRLDAPAAMRVRRFVRGTDVVHAQDRRSGFWLRMLPPRRPAARVYTVHGLPDPYLPPPAGAAHPGLRAQLAYRGLDAWLCRRADALVVPSQAMADILMERLGFPAGRITVIPNGVHPRPARTRDGALIGCMSVLEPVKALDVFLHAGAALARERADVRLGLFGTGSEAARLSALTAELGLEDRVETPGHVPTEQALARLRIFVLCSYMENCPMSLLEAMAAGIPVVATAVGGVPEIVSDGAGLLVPAGNAHALAEAIASLLDHPARARELGDAGRRRVLERFTADGNALATLHLYERLLEART
jgi:glycosyltransferase involved in cell wall biosynthesis